MQRLFVRKYIVWTLIVLIAVAGWVFAQEDEVVVEPGEAVNLGFAASLSGDTAPFGIDIQRGVELAQEDRPTVEVDGVEFDVTFDPQDSACNAETGQAVANRFASDASIVAVIGHMCSSSCAAAAPIYDSAGYSMVSPSCTAPSLTQREFTSFNRAVVSDAVQGPAAAQFIYEDLEVTRIATIHDGSAYGEGLVSVVEPAFEDLGGEVVASDAVNVGDTDFRALLEDLAAAEPELIYFAGFPAEGALLAQQIQDVGGLEDVIFMSADGLQGPEFIELAGDSSEGVYTSVAIPYSSDALDSFLERYIETYEEEPPGPYHSNGYDAYNLILDAIEATASVDDDGNLVISRASIAEYLRSFENFEGLTGLLTADGTGETASLDVGFFVVEDGDNAQVKVIGEGCEVAEGESDEEAEGSC
jgi:branched-chain amino acid transport system substrate-binding protein